MSIEIIYVNYEAIRIKEWQGVPVVLLKDIDAVHQRDYGVTESAFQGNRNRFIEGEDFFKITAEQFKKEYGYDTIPEKETGDVYLITEIGYALLEKLFDDDPDFTVQRELVKNYFKAMEIRERNNRVTYRDKTFRGKQCITSGEAVRILNLDETEMEKFLHSHCVETVDYEMAQRNLFTIENPEFDFPVGEKSIEILYASGFQNVCRHFGVNYLDQKYFLPAVTERQLIETRKKRLKDGMVQLVPDAGAFDTMKEAKKHAATLNALLAMYDSVNYFRLPNWFFDALHETAARLEQECARMYRWDVTENFPEEKEEGEK